MSAYGLMCIFLLRRTGGGDGGDGERAAGRGREGTRACVGDGGYAVLVVPVLYSPKEDDGRGRFGELRMSEASIRRDAPWAAIATALETFVRGRAVGFSATAAISVGVGV